MPFALRPFGLPSGLAAARLPPFGLVGFAFAVPAIGWLVGASCFTVTAGFGGPFWFARGSLVVVGSSCGAAEPFARGACELILEALALGVDIKIVEFLGSWVTPLIWLSVTIGKVATCEFVEEARVIEVRRTMPLDGLAERILWSSSYVVGFVGVGGRLGRGFYSDCSGYLDL